MSRAHLLRWLCPLVLGACKPDLGPGDSLVTSTRVLAVKMAPAEAAPGALVTFTAFVATADGTSSAEPIVWSFCTAPKPLTVDNVVSNACLGASSLAPIATGPAVNALLPSDGCSLFGPDVPPGNFRPRDPDVTGGYYQPVRGDLAGTDTVFDLARLTCPLANAPPDVVASFTKAYVPNANPHIAGLVGAILGTPITGTQVPAGARVTLEASWPPADAETYAYVDPESQTLQTKRESMRVAWYASAGAFDAQSTGRAEADTAAFTDGTWTTPGTPGKVHVWIVLRDSRGGVDFAGYDFDVTP
jgi:hypothetical protein